MIRIGIIGAGPNATGHGEYYAKSTRAKVVAVADVATDRAAKLAEICSAKAIADYKQMLGDIDAVVIASPNFLHKEQAIACAEAGKHVYCEKPMGLSAADAREIAAAIARAKVKSAVGFSVRFDRTIQTMQAMARQGKLGQIVSIMSRRIGYMDPSTQQGWRADHNLSGGLLMEINIHELEWMMALGGEVESVYARTRVTSKASGPRANDHIWVTLNFAAGAVGMHEGSWMGPMPAYFRGINGTAGGACTDEWGSKVYYAPAGQNRVDAPMEGPYDLRGNFLDSIEKGAPGVADAEWGVKVMSVAEAVFQSAARNVPVNPTSV
jgi:predicted dehydrogenase